MQSSQFDDPLWFKDAIIYEVPVRAFADSNGDGIGDFRGLTEKLDYLQALGVTALWVLPFFPSPLKDDGYDIADYTNVNPIYGTLEDFQEFLAAAHQRNIRVIIELIVNHTSDQHPWFQRARRAPKGSSERDFYVWSDTPEKYQDARIIFQDFELSNWSWDPLAKAYFWHRFYHHQPDLNYENPAVQKAVFEVLDFWLEMGVDGFRLDAVPYLYEQEGTNCENLSETHAFLKALRSHIDSKFPNRVLLAEANQWAEDAAKYYGDGDECHMNFHFPLMPRLFMALRMEDNFPISDILQQTPEIPENCQWAVFLRNHDELTLEMVTDEDRDYMYRVYAKDPAMRVNLGIRRRLAPLMGNDRRQIELLNALLLSLPGTPVLYYGDEIGMGDNVFVGDRNGVRTPMQWSDDRNAGFSRANPQRLYLPVVVDSEYHYAAVNVEAQRANPNSLWYWMKRLITTRKRFQAFGRGNFEILHPENRKVFAFTRTYEDEQILVVANLSRSVQIVGLDLTSFQGKIPVEIFGQTEFPAITDSLYSLSLAPYGFYWFSLTPSRVETTFSREDLPTLSIHREWQSLFTETALRQSLESILASYLPTCEWFQHRDRIQSVQIIDHIEIDRGSYDAASCGNHSLLLLQVDYFQSDSQTYVLFVSCASGETATHLMAENRQAAIAQLTGTLENGILFDASVDRTFMITLLEAIQDKLHYTGAIGKLTASRAKTFLPLTQIHTTTLRSELNRVLGAYSDTSTETHDPQHYLLKLFRQVEEGINPDLEIRQFLGEACPFIAKVTGVIEYQASKVSSSTTIGILQEHIPDAQNAWDYTLDSLRNFIERVLTQQLDPTEATIAEPSLLKLQSLEIPDLAYQLIDTYLTNVQLLGERTAEFHRALAANQENPSFAPEPFSSFYQRSIYQYARNLTGRVFLQLQKQCSTLPAELQTQAKAVLERQNEFLDRFGLILEQKITALRTRYHGDYHLAQVLYTGKDFVIHNFEGNPTRPLSERRMKRSALRDVASMIQSFNYATHYALSHAIQNAEVQPEDVKLTKQWTQFWYEWVSAAFLKSYFAIATQDQFLPQSEAEMKVLLNAYLLEKMIYGLGYSMNYSPDQLEFALARLLEFPA